MASNSSSPADNAPGTISTSGFGASYTLVEGKMTITLKGNADSDVSVAFSEYLRARHEEATRRSLSEVVLDCRDLYFLTSSCIKGLATWIKWLMSTESRLQYRLTFLMTPNLRWQERSFEVLCQMCPALVRMTSTVD